MPGSPDPVHTYALLDAARVPGLIETLETTRLEHGCLFRGESFDRMKDVAPWLVRIDSSGKFTRNLFRASGKSWHLWGKGAGIFIRSTAPLDELTAHLRRFTKVSDPAGKWVFFRFWDPLVAQIYFDGMADHADRIGQVFRLPSGKLTSSSRQMSAACPPAIVARVRMIGPGGTDAAADETLKLFNQTAGQPQCRPAVLAELLSRLPRSASDRYAALLMSETTLRPWELTAELRQDVARLLTSIPVRAGWEREALGAFRALGIDRRAEFPLLNDMPAGDTAISDDARAVEKLAAMTDNVAQRTTLLTMLREVSDAAPAQARPLLSRHLNDQHKLPSGMPSGVGMTVAGQVQMMLLGL